MLKTIISASSNPDSVVMDFFCGSGSTLEAAQELGRKWIGIDKSEKAIEVTKNRLKNNDLFNTGFDFLEEKEKSLFIEETKLKNSKETA